MTVVFERSVVSTDYVPVILWNNIPESDSVTLTSSSGDGENALDYATNTYWTPTSLPATLTADFGSDVGASYFGVCSHNLSSVGARIFLQTSADGLSWTSVVDHIPTDDSILFFPFTYTESRYWRFRIQGTTTPSVGVIFLGEGLQFETGIMPSYTPMYMAEDIELMTAQTITGQFMPNRIQRKGLSTSFNLNILDRDFIEGANFQAFRRYYNDGGSFFFASNPAELEDDVAYCWRQSGTIQPTFANNGLFYSTEMALEGFLD